MPNRLVPEEPGGTDGEAFLCSWRNYFAQSAATLRRLRWHCATDSFGLRKCVAYDVADFVYCRRINAVPGRKNEDAFGDCLRVGQEQLGVRKIRSVGFHSMNAWIKILSGQNI